MAEDWENFFGKKQKTSQVKAVKRIESGKLDSSEISNIRKEIKLLKTQMNIVKVLCVLAVIFMVAATWLTYKQV